MQMRSPKLDDGLPFAVISPKDYGTEYEQPSFFDRHGKQIGFISCTISSIIVVGFLVWAVMFPLTEMICRFAAR